MCVFCLLGPISELTLYCHIQRTFFEALQHRRYDKWKLKDITIWQGGQEMDWESMRALARSIPSVMSFFGNGHMMFEPSETPRYQRRGHAPSIILSTHLPAPP